MSGHPYYVKRYDVEGGLNMSSLRTYRVTAREEEYVTLVVNGDWTVKVDRSSFERFEEECFV